MILSFSIERKMKERWLGKKKECTKEFWKLALMMLDQVTKGFAIIHLKNTEIIKFLITFYPLWDFNEDLTSSINCQNDKHKVERYIYIYIYIYIHIRLWEEDDAK